MNLETMLQRAQEIETAIVNMAGQLNALHGHKAETAHWIKQLQEAQVESTPVEVPVANPDELPVE